MSPGVRNFFLNWQRRAGNRRLFLLCVLLFGIGFLATFWLAFPADILQERVVKEISRQTGMEMEGENGNLLFPLGLGLDLRFEPPQPELATLTVHNLRLTPVWTRLASGTKAVALTGEFADGELSAQVIPEATSLLELTNIPVEKLLDPDLPYRVQGRLSGGLSAERLASVSQTSGQFQLQVSNARVLGLERFGLPEPFQLGLLQLGGKFNQRRLSLDKVLLTEGLMEMSGGGTLFVGETPATTRLNLNVRLLPVQSTPQSLRDLISLSGVKPTADGSYLLRISGTLARPTIR